MICEKKINVIIAPHCDDELIGCFEIMENYPTTIIYTEPCIDTRKYETERLHKHFSYLSLMYGSEIPNMFLTKNNVQLFFPDPIYEIHPIHRKWGSVGENYLRSGYDVCFYNTTMTAPYIREVKSPTKKRNTLNLVYPSQADLWKYDHKYFLFEGYTKWILQP